LRLAGHTVVGTDVSPVAIEKFKAQGWEGVLCDLETQKLRFPDGSFDLVYASEMIEHCADSRAVLSEISRLLKPGGMLVLSTPNSAFWPYRILALLGQTPSEYQHPGHVRFFSKRSLLNTIESAGFEIVSTSARHMYIVLGSFGDPFAPLLRLFGFEKESRFATGGSFWQLSRFSRRPSGFWADTLFVVACKSEAAPNEMR